MDYISGLIYFLLCLVMYRSNNFQFHKYRRTGRKIYSDLTLFDANAVVVLN